MPEERRGVRQRLRLVLPAATVSLVLLTSATTAAGMAVWAEVLGSAALGALAAAVVLATVEAVVD